MKVFFYLTLLIFLLFISCQCTSCSNNKIKGYTSQSNTLRLKSSIPYDEVFIRNCPKNEENVIGFNATHLHLDSKRLDSVNIYVNDSLVYQHHMDNIINRLIINYDPKHDRIAKKVKGFVNLDSTAVNIIKVVYVDRASFVEFQIKEHTTKIILKEDSPNWKIIYTNCLAQRDE